LKRKRFKGNNKHKVMPTLIKLIPDRASQETIRAYLEENREQILHPKDRFHSTVLYSETTPIFRRGLLDRLKGNLPLMILPSSLDIFGKKDLVLRYESKIVEIMEEEILNGALKQILGWANGLSRYESQTLERSLSAGLGEVYLDSNYHVSIAKDFDGDVADLPPFEDSISFDILSWEVRF
jgi:hypothetical protein